MKIPLARSSAGRSILTGSILLGAVLFATGGPDTKAPAVPEPAKNAPLSFAHGAVVFDVEERVRLEVRSNNREFDSSVNDANDDTWVLNRFRLGVALQPSRWLKVYGQFQDAQEWDSERPNVPGVQGTEGGDSDLRLAYAEVGNLKALPLALTAGRQRLHYGDARLVGDSRWGNFGRSFDAVKLRFEQPKFWVEAFAARPVVIKEEVINDSDAQDNLLGAYLSTSVLPFQTTDFYVFYRDKQDNQPDLDPTNTLDPRGSWNGPAQRVYTVGTRVESQKGLMHNWDYRGELAYQFGDLWANDRTSPRLEQHAFAAHASGGYTWGQNPHHPRLGLEYDYATGDHHPGDGKSQSFQNLFPANHEKYGYMDEFSLRNLHDARVQFTVDVSAKVQAEVNYHAFWLADTSDYWFRSNGFNPLRTRTPSGVDVRTVDANRFAGHEVDFVLRWNLAKWMIFDTGYSHFFAGNYLSDTGASDDADFGYAQMLITF